MEYKDIREALTRGPLKYSVEDLEKEADHYFELAKARNDTFESNMFFNVAGFFIESAVVTANSLRGEKESQRLYKKAANIFTDISEQYANTGKTKKATDALGKVKDYNLIIRKYDLNFYFDIKRIENIRKKITAS